MAANLPKRCLTQVVKSRSYSSAAHPFAPHGGANMERTQKMWKYLSFAGFPILGLCMVYNWLIHVEHEKHFKRPEFIPYSYLAKRNKKFPWGDGNHTLFHNPRTNALPDGYEVDY